MERQVHPTQEEVGVTATIPKGVEKQVEAQVNVLIRNRCTLKAIEIILL